MRILVVYGTSEGHTRKISRFIEEVLQNEGHQVIIADATEEPPSADIYDMVLIASSIHMHKYNPAIKDYVLSNIDRLNSAPSAFFSVCMAVASDIEEEHLEADAIATSFLKDTSWNTNNIFHVAGALRYTKYDYFKKLIMRMIAKKQGGSTDTSQDHEYTDWEALKSQVLKLV